MISIDKHEELVIKTAKTELDIIEGQGGIPVVKVANAHATAAISMQGAQVVSWVPQGEKEVIWVSGDASYAPGKSLRGGIPICWPWFGAHDERADWPAHGFARTSMWQLEETEELGNGDSRLYFSMRATDQNRSMWPSDVSLSYIVTVGKKLEMELITHNNGTEAVVIGDALHTYFAVGDIDHTVVLGLDETEYLDKLDDFARKTQSGAVSIESEVDRVYVDTTSECVIDDAANQRKIVIIKNGSHSTVVWNPWEETANKMGDLGEDGYKRMLCVESCNAKDNVVTVEPGKAHHLWVQYEVQR